MSVVATVKNPILNDSAVSQLGTIGAVVAQRFANRIEPLDLKPVHVGVLSLLAVNPASSQLDIATAMKVVPSLIVRIADHLESLGAVERTRDPDDRRRQTLRLTDHGRALLKDCQVISDDLETQLLAGLSPAQHTALTGTLRHVAGNLGLTF